jgi:hypothetical protein
LPEGLDELVCHTTALTALPPLPSTLETLECHDTRLPILPLDGEDVQAYAVRWEELRHRGRVAEKMRVLKEDLMAAAWHPRRVERVLTLGGEAVFDAWMGW